MRERKRREKRGILPYEERGLERKRDRERESESKQRVGEGS